MKCPYCSYEESKVIDLVLPMMAKESAEEESA